MRKSHRKLVAVLLILLLAGFVKSPWERAMTRRFMADQLLMKPLDIEVREKIGQTGAAVALGGLRPVVATFLNLRAYGSFEDRAWVRLEDQFQTLVALQPQTTYYWDVGAWHLSYNAAVDFRESETLPAPRREAMYREYVLKGRAFLERGIRNNPDDWTLLSSLGRFYGNPDKFPDYAKSADAYQKAWLSGKARRYEARAWLYSLARVTGRENDALLLARKLFETEQNRVATLLCLLFALESAQVDAKPTLDLVHGIFPSEKDALLMLTTYRDNNAEQLPLTGVDYAITLLASRQKPSDH